LSNGQILVCPLQNEIDIVQVISARLERLGIEYMRTRSTLSAQKKTMLDAKIMSPGLFTMGECA
jgi:hypothetical protein